jgi:outer membrane lipoprotein-sorting protein
VIGIAALVMTAARITTAGAAAPPAAAPAPAASMTPAARLAILDRERNALRALSFTAVIETPKAGGRTGRSSLTFQFLAPNRFRSEIKMGLEGTLLTVADGTTIWSWESRARKLYRQDQAVAASRLRSYGPVDPITALATPTVPLATLFRAEASRDSRDVRDAHSVRDAGDVAIIELVPKRSVPNYDRLVITTSRDGRTLRSAETWQKGAPTARVIFGEMKRNATPAPSLFTFTPVAGVRAVEIR